MLYLDLLLTFGFAYLGSAAVQNPESKLLAGFLTGLLGGTVRSVIFKQKIVWIENPDYLAAVVIGVCVDMLVGFLLNNGT